jgi:acyl carrier protein
LDSLGLVNLITLIEETIEDEFDVTVTLADDKAMSRKTSPFRTLNHLLEYVGELLEAH